MDDSDLYIKDDPFSYNTQASFWIEFDSCREAERRRLGHTSASNNKKRRLGKAIRRRLQEEEDGEFLDDEGDKFDEGDENQEFNDDGGDF